MRIYLESMSTEIFEDHFNEGLGESTGCGLQDVKIGRAFDTLEDMLKYLDTAFGLPCEEVNYRMQPGTLEASKQVADHSQAQNGGWFDPTATEMAAWAAGTGKMYCEECVIHYRWIAE